jgi:hypothetical protein
MADRAPLSDLLDRAGNVFTLAGKLGHAFHEAGQSRAIFYDPSIWDTHSPTFREFCAKLLELRDVMQNPPDGFACVGERLLEAARIAKAIREDIARESRRNLDSWDGQPMATMLGIKNPGPPAFTAYLEYFPNLNTTCQSGWDAVKEVIKTLKLDDPFGFIDDSPARKQADINTTPTLPKPPVGLVDAAEREIPRILANVAPSHGSAIEVVASHLAKRLQDAGHTLAAAHWAVHRAVLANRLRPGLIEVDLPSFGRTVGGTMRHWGGPDDRHIEWTGGGTGTVPIPKGKPAPFDSFKVTATDSLWAWWQTSAAEPPKHVERPTSKTKSAAISKADPGPSESKKLASDSSSQRRTKRSTERGEGRAKLIAALTKHHKYADNGALNLEPIGNNVLARLAEVSESTASAFFGKEFGGHAKYRATCANAAQLVAALKLLNQEFSPHHLFGANPPGESDRDEV